MTEQECLAKMVPPGVHRPGKYGSDKGFGGVIQIHVTRACNLSCFNCTQGSNLGGKTHFMPPEMFEAAVRSLDGYPGIVGVFGGNPATHPRFDELCKVLRLLVPQERCGLWCNDPMGWGPQMRTTFNPRVSNLNVHLSRDAFAEFKRDWPESQPFGLTEDSRHSPVYVAMRDLLERECPECSGQRGFYVAPNGDRYHSHEDETEWQGCGRCEASGKIYDEARAYDLISRCDINQHWSAMIGMFRGELRAWFCEIAGAQSILHQDEPDYPDTGLPIARIEMETTGRTELVGMNWWRLPMQAFADQVRRHCHDCGVPLRGYGEMAQASEHVGHEQVSITHAGVYRPKRKGRDVQTVTRLEQLGTGRIQKVTHYVQNGRVK